MGWGVKSDFSSLEVNHMSEPQQHPPEPFDRVDFSANTQIGHTALEGHLEGNPKP